MYYDKGNQLTVGELKNLIRNIPDETKLSIGFGSDVKPLRYLCEHNGGLMFHTDVYGVDAVTNNIRTSILLSDK